MKFKKMEGNKCSFVQLMMKVLNADVKKKDNEL